MSKGSGYFEYHRNVVAVVDSLLTLAYTARGVLLQRPGEVKRGGGIDAQQQC